VTWQTTDQSPTLTLSAKYSNVWLKINYKSTFPCHQTSTPSNQLTSHFIQLRQPFTNLQVVNDLLSAVDSGKPSISLSFDISAAFDTLDLTRLLQRASELFGLNDHVLSWLMSYLISRSSYVALRIVTPQLFVAILAFRKASFSDLCSSPFFNTRWSINLYL